jgi:hypothetical protein
MHNSLKNKIKDLSIQRKFVLIGFGITFLSVFFPWYSDIDKYNGGDVFLGITGPLYLVGLIVLLTSAASFGIIILKLLDKPMIKLPVKEHYFFLFSSSLNIFMMIFSLSVFFHSKFGYSLLDKNVGIGMIFGFVGSGLIILGSFLEIKKKEHNILEESVIEPLIAYDPPLRDNRGIGSDKIIKKSVQESIDEFTSSLNHTNDIKK